MSEIILNGTSLSVEEVERIALEPELSVSLDSATLELVDASRSLVDLWVDEGKVIYGVTTGFGEFANVSIGRDDIEQLQSNLIRSHAVGSGAAMPKSVTRGMMALRINALLKGYSGIRRSVLVTLVDMLNADIIPVVPMQGSVGSSGDLVPLAHLALGAMGEGNGWNGSGQSPIAELMRSAEITPVRLKAKEGLALINGTQYMTSYGSIALSRLARLVKAADIIAALSTDALRGTDRAFDERLHRARPHKDQLGVASNMRRLLAGSGIRESHREGDDRVQDAYSIRCIPQVHGACRNSIGFVRETVTIEINSATDNPLIFPDDRDHVEGGNFHGEPVAIPLDLLAIAASELANISERRTERLVNGSLSRLPRFLTPRGGLNSGFMIAQYTAAAIVSENKVLSHPASVDSIPTSANQEDHNSMGSISARKAYQVVDNLASVLGIELLCACQGIDFLRPLKSSPALEAAHTLLRSRVAILEEDRYLQPDVEAARNLVLNGELVRSVEDVLSEKLD